MARSNISSSSRLIALSLIIAYIIFFSACLNDATRRISPKAVNGILDHSVVPLRAAIWTGLTVSCLSMLLLAAYLITWWLGIGNWPRGFATTTLLILFSIGLNSVFLGILGEYLGRIYRVLKKTSRIHIEERISGGRSATEH